jgi:hypothetical protein
LADFCQAFTSSFKSHSTFHFLLSVWLAAQFTRLTDNCAFRHAELPAAVERLVAPRFLSLFEMPAWIADDLLAAGVSKVPYGCQDHDNLEARPCEQFVRFHQP